ncbi:unnamed protein product [Staurois parvus]|uniref:Uncharacterized protein n=1 Tax=Staurois parvus TaxID=386267 RepID=A0ABN9C070_9NEOB|nr:unnamed protein product [Staurois parvus]
MITLPVHCACYIICSNKQSVQTLVQPGAQALCILLIITFFWADGFSAHPGWVL